MLGATVAATIMFPIVGPILIAADVIRVRWRLPLLRVYLFALQYMINDSVEILLAPVYWVAAGFGTRLRSPASIARHQRLQWWSVSILERRAEQLLGLRVNVSAEASTELTEAGGGPVIVISRHVSLFDASLSGLLFWREGFQVRGIIMAELLADPGFDLLYGRLGSVFIPRDDGGRARDEVKRLTASTSNDDLSTTAFVLFPEGRLFQPDVKKRALERLATGDPERAERLSALRHTLPPRPGGLLILMDALPEADIVLVDHRGLDAYPSLGLMTSLVPLTDPVTVTARRIARTDIPSDEAGRVEWLDELWLEIDRSLDEEAQPVRP